MYGKISLWRPMLPVIEAYPLTACTYTSTVIGDTVPIDVVYPHYAEESFEISHSLSHQWFWKSAMTHKDIMLIKLFDNKMDQDTAFCKLDAWRGTKPGKFRYPADTVNRCATWKLERPQCGERRPAQEKHRASVHGFWWRLRVRSVKRNAHFEFKL